MLTCCYCGSRAALVLRGAVRHELSCASCGAPLHDLKQMPVSARPTMARADGYADTQARPMKKPKKRHKKRKSRRKDWFEEIFDVIEDIFD
ncbi:hypothetical protein [Thiosulfatihalobacter marinus]|uniref:hypothetical protein n=1 Tax=Thiosulfatihalobacter marinus TaxID=2792481 RepID=UPI0018D896F0|nr:hypothetical protein [Thiosulfatihalobacter marinus]